MTSTFVLGLDAGPPGEPTGFCILERPANDQSSNEACYHLRHIERFAPGTSYPAIIQSVVDRVDAAHLTGWPCVVDQTGVGKVFIRQCWQIQSELDVYPIIVSAGQMSHMADDGTRVVPKRDLIMTLQMVLQTRRLKIAPDLALADLLMTEFAAYRLRNLAADADASEWREGRHDDLVFSVALAVWFSERNPMMRDTIQIIPRRHVFDRPRGAMRGLFGQGGRPSIRGLHGF